MAIYGISIYAQSVYGYTAPPQFSVDPFTATPQDYGTILLSWVKPAGTITAWRLVKNMNGFPTDQDDGVVVVDSAAGYPGNSYADINITPGAYHYYGFFVQVNVEEDLWVGAGSTGCLMLNSYNSAESMLNFIPGFYIESANNTDELQADPTGNLYLNKLMAVFGWGMDYLRTQYDTYQNFNDPLNMPVNDLYNLALELGIDINPAISPYTLRKAVYNNAVINKGKGTLQGVTSELAALTGWAADISIGENLMLSNDQSFFEDPDAQPWNPFLSYNVGELVEYDSYIYVCIASPNYGQHPTGTTASNTWWQVQQYVPTAVMDNTLTAGVDTWEGIYAVSPTTGIPPNALEELIGAQDPISTLHNTANVLQLKNTSSSTTDLWMRSVSRTGAETPFTQVPDKYQAVADGVPVPTAIAAQKWDHAVTYYPREIVMYNNVPYRALRTSVNSLPPYSAPGTANEDWEPLGYDERIRFVTSSYTRGSALTVTPFVEWYDSSGNFITRVFAKNSGSPPSRPSGVAFDSFVTGVGQSLTDYPSTDDGVYSWTVADGGFLISPYAGGCAYPSSQSTRSIAVVDTGSGNAQAGLTFITNPTSTWNTGLVMRYASDTSYLLATMTQLVENNGGSYSIIGEYSQPCVSGDRVTVKLNGPSVTVYRNGVQVLTVATSFNQSSTKFGIAYEQFSGTVVTDEYTSTYLADYGS